MCVEMETVPLGWYDSSTVLRKKSFARSKISLDWMPERMTRQIGMGLSGVPDKFNMEVVSL